MVPNHARKAVALILARMHPEDSQHEESTGAKGGDEGLESAAEDLIAAIHEKDAAGVVAALKAAFEMLDSAEAEPSEDVSDEG